MIAFVTGATSGFGAAIARRFIRDGHRVIAAGRRRERLDELRKELGTRLHPVELDVQDRAAVEAAFANLPADFAAVDVLVNNAGLALGLQPAQAADLDDWDAMIDTNVKGLAYCSRATKAFVHHFSLNLRADLLGTAVRVTDVQPGMCAGTEFSQVRFHGDAARAAKVYEGIEQPLTAEDVADTVAWVVSRPAHLNVNSIEVMPVAQAINTFKFDRKT